MSRCLNFAVKIFIMLNAVLADLYERDLRTMIEEVNLFNNEENLWRTQGSIKNSSGNLVLHIIGGLNHFFGATLAHSGYVRERDQEFIRKNVARKELVDQLEAVILIVTKTLGSLTPEEMTAD